MKDTNLNRENIESLGLKYITTENFGTSKSIEYFTTIRGDNNYVLYWDNKSNNFWFLVSSVPLEGPDNLSINLRNYFKGDQVTIIDKTVYNTMGELEQDVFKYLSPGECCVNWGGFELSDLSTPLESPWKPKDYDYLSVEESIEIAKRRRIQDSNSYVHTKKMSIEDLLEEYGDNLTKDNIKQLKKLTK